MNRRKLLTLFGLAPIAAVLPASAAIRSGTVELGRIFAGGVTWHDRVTPVEREYIESALHLKFLDATKDTRPANWFRDE